MTSYSVLPFPFKPDWKQPIIERLSWLTAIQTSRSGAEQRQALRLAPRRQIDIPLVLHGQERSYFELLIARQGGSQWWAPIPHEEFYAGAIPAGSTFIGNGAFVQGYVDPTYREISLGTKLLIRSDCFHCELVEVNYLSSPGQPGLIGFTPTVFNHTNATITPCFIATIDNKIEATRHTARTYSVTVRFTSAYPVRWPATDRTPATLSAGFSADQNSPYYYLLTTPPNAVNDLTYTYERNWSVIDNQMSNPQWIDKSDRSFKTQQYEFFLTGAKDRQQFRDVLFALQGRCKPIWVPTFNDDLNAFTEDYPDTFGLGDPFPPIGCTYYAEFDASGAVTVHSVGRGYTGDPYEGYENGSIFRRSFMTLKRLDMDEIELQHYTTIEEGAMTVSVIFRDAPDLRHPLGLVTQGYPLAGYYNTNDQFVAFATNPSTSLNDVVTIQGPPGGLP